MNDPVLVMLNYLTNKLNDMAKEIENLREDLKVERDCGDRLRDELTKAEIKDENRWDDPIRKMGWPAAHVSRFP